MKTEDPELLRRHTAYHVSGHVIADLVFGYRFRYVTIRPNDVEKDDGAICGTTRGRAQDLAVVQLAGIAASAKMMGCDPWENPDRFDDNHADIAGSRIFIDNWAGFLFRTYGASAVRDQICEEIRQKTQLLADQNWKAIEVIAGELLEKEILTYDDVVRILKEQCPDFTIGEKH